MVHIALHWRCHLLFEDVFDVTVRIILKRFILLGNSGRDGPAAIPRKTISDGFLKVFSLKLSFLFRADA